MGAPQEEQPIRSALTRAWRLTRRLLARLATGGLPLAAGTCLATGGVAAANVLVEKPGALTGARTVGVEIFRQRPR